MSINNQYCENIRRFHQRYGSPFADESLADIMFWSGDFETAYAKKFGKNLNSVFKDAQEDRDNDIQSRTLRNAQRVADSLRMMDPCSVEGSLKRWDINGILNGLELPRLREADFHAPQMKEAPDEQYAVVVRADETLRNHAKRGDLQEFVQRMIRQSQSLDDPDGCAEASFYLGEYGFMIDNYKGAYHGFGRAARMYRDQALYYGYAANSWFRYAKSGGQQGYLTDHAVMLIWNSRALQLDPENPRWYFYQALGLQNMALCTFRDSLKMALRFAISSKNFLRYGRTLLRPDQRGFGKSFDDVERNFDVFIQKFQELAEA